MSLLEKVLKAVQHEGAGHAAAVDRQGVRMDIAAEEKSTKPDIRNHGFGIANVRDTAQKYGGLLYIEQNGDRFTAVLTIAKSCLARYNGTVEK